MCYLSINPKYSYYANLKYFRLKLSLWSSGQSSWLQIERSGFDSRRYQILVGLERGPQTRKYNWEATWKKK
jgi:hypothetical protein